MTVQTSTPETVKWSWNSGEGVAATAAGYIEIIDVMNGANPPRTTRTSSP